MFSRKIFYLAPDSTTNGSETFPYELAKAKTVDDVWDAYNNSTYVLDEIIADTQNFSWVPHLNTFGIGSVLYMMNPGKKNLTSNAATSLSIKLTNLYVQRFYDVGLGFDFPLSYLYDPRYNRMAPNLINIPYEHQDPSKFITKSKATIYLEVRYYW